MKRRKILSGLLTAAVLASSLSSGMVTAQAAGGVKISEKNFPDENFREYVSENFDTDGNGRLSPEETAAVTEIDTWNKGVLSLKGIEYFTELEKLNCIGNEIDELDVSGNRKLKKLYCGCTYQIAVLDLSKNTELEYLSCRSCALTELDVSANKKLKELHCGGNKLMALDISANIKLRKLDCSFNNIKELDVSRNKKLDFIWCEDNKLTKLDVSRNNKLEMLYVSDNKLTGLDVSGNSKLKQLSCCNNRLTGLDLSQNTKLRGLWCFGNRMTVLDLSNNKELEGENVSIDENVVVTGYDGHYNKIKAH